MDQNYATVHKVQVNIQPLWMVCDQVFRYHVGEGVVSTHVIPNFVKCCRGRKSEVALTMSNTKCSNLAKNMELLDVSEEGFQIRC